MLVSKISNSNRNTFLFGRKLRKDEEQDYRENALQPAFDYLGTEEVAMIVHGTSYPEKAQDLGVGSPYGKAAAKFIPFEILHGFNSNQLAHFTLQIYSFYKKLFIYGFERLDY